MVLIHTLKEKRVLLMTRVQSTAPNIKSQIKRYESVIPALPPTDGRQRKENQLEACRRVALPGAWHVAEATRETQTQ